MKKLNENKMYILIYDEKRQEMAFAPADEKARKKRGKKRRRRKHKAVNYE